LKFGLYACLKFGALLLQWRTSEILLSATTQFHNHGDPLWWVTTRCQLIWPNLKLPT
jgi:hypothetical protein